ncbi:MAG TPA: organic solvent tolerance protein OstA, partial [Planctomycetaceae bacterium]|nr:organic solvent tolerance protein OstA [Planctomycetaceae bacterium]
EVVPDPISGQLVGTATGGIRVIVEGIEAPEVQRLGTSLGKIVLETDNVVLWGPNIEQLQNGETTDFEDLPLEIYMEGNVVFREGDRVVYAERMYYDVRQRAGTVLDAEILTPVEQYEGLLRVRAEVLQQLDANTFQAFGGAVTSSRIGFPRYWLQADNIQLKDIQIPLTNYFTGEPERDPRTGEQAVAHELRTTSRSNFLYLSGLPVLYWPVFSTDLREPTFYVDNLSFSSDNVFGTQVRVDWNAYQLFGIREPLYGTDWQLSTDYLSDRGPAAGTQFTYARRDMLGVPGPYSGIFDVWGIYDTGLDNLGKDRRAVPFPDPLRGRVFLNHQQHFDNGWSLRGELGLISDRNFLEQYFEQAWDTRKDQDTGFELKRIFDNASIGISADFQPLDFYTRTEWLPRADHYRLGRSLGERFTWYAHSHAGYANLITDPLPPPGTQPPQSPLEWETDTTGTRYDSRSGVRAATRQEIDLPFALGPTKFTPYLLGEAAYWGEDRDGNEATRLYGQVGIRSSLPMWTANPTVQSPLFNVNGLAHKVSFDTELFYADADQNLDRFPLYDPLNDDSVEQFERMFIANRFAGVRPTRFDPRQFALRSGMQSWVTGPTEIADDLTVFNASVRQRLQTKRGMPGNERVVDWITLDVGATLFPEADRDNFGSEVGLINYDFRWFLGDRLTLLSDGYADMFGDGLQEYTIGALISRPEFGNAYLGFRNIDGPFSSSVMTGSVSYRMSEKWIVTASGSFDFGPTGNIGQTVAITKLGESFLVRAGVNIDVGRGNVGAVFSIEPRFLPRSRLGMVGGVQIPPAGARGIE